MEDVQREAFSALLRRFQEAAGALEGNAVVDALVKSYLHMTDKINRGKVSRVRTSAFMTGEIAADLAYTLGRGRGVSELLKPPSLVSGKLCAFPRIVLMCLVSGYVKQCQPVSLNLPAGNLC